MNEDARLVEAMAALGPAPAQVARVQAIVEARVERERTPLFAEWLDLLRARPLANGGLALACGAALLLTTPLGSLLWALLRAGRA